MTAFLTLTVIILLALFVLGLARIYIGPTQADRILAVQLSGTTTVAILIVLSHLLAMTALLHAALLFVLFAALIAVAFVRHPRSER
ncbi:monovalent cation/H+ antiporter complex subunit F [Aquisalimonas asiatica]|uniref:Multisubunit sodium/proton antiporter, MrpF subunit n=1 Tax=Aquisalimonas asiatica TaxID=406100 RepID=A0A1H8PTC8_9GAMM|nr:monovalent cation/H+ antiporter complex subunit F [Aquisalimonas asiatica]SEO45210.1 multisubunit sodium/proton antiporter, MrpF subunit [Aquisalimonas asiatica]